MINSNKNIHPVLLNYIEESVSNFNSINEERKVLLSEVAEYIKRKVSDKQEIRLTFICTHNSRRSHLSQLWAQAAAIYYNIPNVKCFSAGTEATAFNPRAVKAIKKAGFEVKTTEQGDNPRYKVSISANDEPVLAFSKTITDSFNPQEGFAAIMTCDSADEACPVVFGADARFPVKYEDPKVADDTPEEETRYNERCRQISVEMLYTFSLINS